MRTEAQIQASKNYYERQKELGRYQTSFLITKDEAKELRKHLKKLRKTKS